MKDNKVALEIIKILADGAFHSGEQLGGQFGISRAAINQHIQIIKSWGLAIKTVTGKGYSLLEPLTLLDQQIISEKIQTDSNNIKVIPIIDSTNQYLIERMPSLQPGAVCVAEYQQAGRGRRGRQWFSPFGANLYFSMYWKLEQGPAAAMGLSLVVGIIMAETLTELGASQVRVKWPNDIYVHDRKLAGILVEMSGRTGDVAHAVIGAGINLNMSEDRKQIIDQPWISLQSAGITIDRNELCAALIDKLRFNLRKFEDEGLAGFIRRWNDFDNFINRPVKLLIGDRFEEGIARGIDKNGALLLEQSGTIKAWLGGEISLRAS